MYRALAIASSLLALAHGQQVGTQTTETHPGMTWQQCTAKGSCTTKNGKVVLDSNWRWLHSTKGTDNCYDGNKWVESICKDNKSCASACALDGADYKGTYGITTSGNALTLKFVTKGSYSTNIGSRTYLMKDDSTYEMFKLAPNNEFTFDVDLSNLPCGLNGALYFVSMDADGGVKKFPNNKAGAKYGTGYCDAQCPRDLKYIDGEANVEGWKPSDNDQNAGIGNSGSCCSEMDIWEANSVSTAYTPHACTTIGQSKCTLDNCGGTYGTDRYAGPCDADGCDFNSYRMGDKTFYGKGKTVDTSKKFTVVTQFHGSGASLDIKRFYVQNNKVIANSQSKIEGLPGNSLTTDFCAKQKTVFNDRDSYNEKGGHPGMSQALSGGMVLVMSLWDDHAANMLWLDSSYPTDKDPSIPGIARGECETTSGVPADVEKNSPNASVIYSNIKFGPINSTFG